MASSSVASAVVTIGLAVVVFYGLRSWMRQKNDLYRVRLPTETVGSPFGIGALKILCLAFFFSALADIAFGVLGIHLLSYRMRYAAPESGGLRAFGDAAGLACGPLFYAVHRRLKIAWKLGWATLIAYLSLTVAGVLAITAGIKKADAPWAAAAAWTVGCLALAVFWGRWWYRQRGYFYRQNPE